MDRIIERRQDLINQVKELYASIASQEDQNHFHQTSVGITPERYYENLLNAVTHEIEEGTFDTCRDGDEIINKVAADKTLLSEWDSSLSAK
ncbi:MAG: hypothetical protein FWE04_05380 [Oscillospiraceae bacterium]|nr:hypothetical protein [Oscillospiraceae bacterium]